MLHSRIFTDKELIAQVTEPEPSIVKIASFTGSMRIGLILTVSLFCRTGLFRLQTRSKLTLALSHAPCAVSHHAVCTCISSTGESRLGSWNRISVMRWHGQNADRMMWRFQALSCFFHMSSFLCLPVGN